MQYRPDDFSDGSHRRDFERRARREAQRRSPDFSPELHDRIMSAVESGRCAKRVDPDAGEIVPRPGQENESRKGVAAAALLVAVIALVILNHGPFEEHQPTANNSIASDVKPVIEQPSMVRVELIEQVPVQVKSAVANTIAQEQFGGLDHDARRMTRYLVDQVPFQDQWNKP
jgi:hypothetical protein